MHGSYTSGGSRVPLSVLTVRVCPARAIPGAWLQVWSAAGAAGAASEGAGVCLAAHNFSAGLSPASPEVYTAAQPDTKGWPAALEVRVFAGLSEVARFTPHHA